MASGSITQVIPEYGKDDKNDCYLKLPDGTLIEWGAVVIEANTSTKNITLPKELTNKNMLTVQITPITSGYVWNANYSAFTTKIINVGAAPATSSRNAYWMVIGRWK